VKCGGDELRVEGRLIKIAHLDTDRYDSLRSPEDVLAEIRRLPRRVDIFTFVEIMPDTTPRFGFHMEMDNAAVLPVSTFDHWWNSQIRSYARNRARQGEKKGVTVREAPFDDALVEGICEVFNETKVRQGRPNLHYGLDLEATRRWAGSFLERSVFVGAYFEDRLIGFAKLVVDLSGTQANLMNIEAMMRHREKAPTNALIAGSVRACADRGIAYLVYQRMVYGNKEDDGLVRFKKDNGFQQVNLPRYYVPHTPLGGLALRCGLHHPLKERLPESVAAKLRELRNAWYNRKLHSEGGGL
jgi:hypothetical protein